MSLIDDREENVESAGNFWFTLISSAWILFLLYLILIQRGFCLGAVLLPFSGYVIKRLATPSELMARVRRDRIIAPPSLPYIAFFYFEPPWKDFADSVADNLPWAAPSYALTITTSEIVDELAQEAQLLLRRAFSDCADVRLVDMPGGRSGAHAYRAYAELALGQHGKWPLPYFLKIGQRAKIFDEYQAYEDRVDPYIPFHLGPHLIRDRCCIGASLGVLVGDYVEESESLHDCACQGRAASAIACLFDRTLIGWHRSPKKELISIAEGLLPYFTQGKKIEHKQFEKRLQCARVLGATKNFGQLRSLFMKCDSKPVWVGPIHGDLHAKNVLVRATDAIVIDFLAHKDFALLYDAACLEASLVVDGFTNDERSIDAWLNSIRALYENDLFDRSSEHPHPTDASNWFHTCVRQIRRYARQWKGRGHEDQYAGALAVALLVKAAKNEEAREPEASRRAAA